MIDTKKIYLSSMLPPDMLDEDYLTSSEDVSNHFIQYEFEDIITNIGRDDFKSTYLNFILDIQKQSFYNQKVLVDHIIDKVQEVYDFTFPENIIVTNYSDVEDIYRFTEFLEFDNIDFLLDILKGFNVDFLNVDPYEFCNDNKYEIIRQINFYNKINLPSIFINLYETLENNIIIKIISTMIYKNKELITNDLKIRELGGL